MRCHSEAIKANLRRRMRLPKAERGLNLCSAGNYMIILYKWRKTWRLQGRVVPASHNDP
jgi:hypothetical protein